MQDGEIQAFIDRDYLRVVRAVTVVCGDRDRAEDVVQEAVVDVWTQRREVDDLAGWITVAAMNRARSRWRTEAAERRAIERLAVRARETTGSGDARLDAQVATALSGLPRRQREVLALHYLLDLSVEDVSRRLGLAVGTVKAHLHRGRSALRAELESSAHRDRAPRGEVSRAER